MVYKIKWGVIERLRLKKRKTITKLHIYINVIKRGKSNVVGFQIWIV